MEARIPVIDLKDIKGKSEVLREACKTWGCFRVVNHGVTPELMAEMKSVTKDLHDLPMEMKQRNIDLVPGSGSGYMPPSDLNHLFEAFGVCDASNLLHLSSFCSDLLLSPHQREIMEKYTQATHKLAIEVASKIAESMGLEDYSFQDHPLHLRMNRYSFSQESISSFGVRKHTDTGFITILQDDETFGGLQVKDPFSATFVAVPSMSGAFLVNLGDSAVLWSNGEVRSVQHQVECEDAGIRISVSTVFPPAVDKIIEPHPGFIDADHPPRYVPITYAQLKNARREHDMYAGEVFEVLRLHK